MKKLLMIFTLLLMTCAMALAQTVQISGTVTGSDDGLPLPGVAVTVKGTTIGISTDTNGKFLLSVPASATTMVFQFIGYKAQEIAIAGQTTINVVMEQDLFAVDEVVVVGYGVQQKRDVAGAISSVKGDNIRLMPVQSFDQTLQGKAAGVMITLPNGVLNNPPVIRVRGFNSISSSSFPLVVVDGVPVFTGDFSANSSAANALADISPSDILSMDILKDASATAIYGSRAANGVILITTRKGTVGPKAKVTYDGFFGYTQPYNLFEVMNAEQYVEHKNLARVNAGGTPPLTPFSLVNDADGNPINTNWSDYIYQTGFQHSHSLSISGATPTTSYYLSVGYSDQEGMVQKNTYSRKNARLNLEHKLNRYITFGANVGFTNGFNSAPNTGSLPGQGFNTAGAGRLAFVLPPNVGPYLNDGTYNISGSALGNMGQPMGALGYYNPVAIFDLNRFTSETDRLLATLSATIQPVKGLFIKTIYGIDNMMVESQTYQTGVTGDSYASNGSIGHSFNRPNRWTWTNTINYDFTVAEKLNLGVLAGAEEQYTKSESWTGSKTNATDPFFQVYQGSWVTAGMGGGGLSENYFLSYFGRFNANFDRKYYFEASVRRDAFSGLSEGNKWGTFGGASLMWNLSRESFIANSNIGANVSDLRLKASYGRVGNISGIGSYESLFLYGSGVYGAAPTWLFTQAGNPNLMWEASDKFDAGLSFGLLSDRIQVDLNYFYNNVNDLILNLPQAPSKGVPGNTVPVNIGAMYNKGFEVTLTTYNITSPNFTWVTNFNFSTLKNEVTALAAPAVNEIVGVTSGLETANRTLVGQAIGMIYGVETRGVDPTTGRRIFVTNDGKEVLYAHELSTANRWFYRDGSGNLGRAVSVAADGKVLGSPIPKIYGGLDNNFTLYDFDMTLSLTYAFGHVVYNGSKAGLRDQRWWNNSKEVYETAWKADGDITNIPKPIFNDNVSNGSAIVMSENVEKGDYVKVRTLAAGYTIKNLPASIGIERIRIYTQLFNAFVFTKYTGSDPEVSTNGNSNLAPGIDRNTAPQARTYSFGVNISF
jgi:TonB-dependent starch-binding outer membrane protein SusC